MDHQPSAKMDCFQSIIMESGRGGGGWEEFTPWLPFRSDSVISSGN